MPVLVAVSQATLENGSCARHASSCPHALRTSHTRSKQRSDSRWHRRPGHRFCLSNHRQFPARPLAEQTHTRMALANRLGGEEKMARFEGSSTGSHFWSIGRESKESWETRALLRSKREGERENEDSTPDRVFCCQLIVETSLNLCNHRITTVTPFFAAQLRSTSDVYGEERVQPTRYAITASTHQHGEGATFD
jgi:hypothetical protein